MNNASSVTSAQMQHLTSLLDTCARLRQSPSGNDAPNTNASQPLVNILKEPMMASVVGLERSRSGATQDPPTQHHAPHMVCIERA